MASDESKPAAAAVESRPPEAAVEVPANPGQALRVAPPGKGSPVPRSTAPSPPRFRAITERGLHPLIQLLILLSFAAAAWLTLDRRRQPHGVGLVSLVETEPRPAEEPSAPKAAPAPQGRPASVPTATESLPEPNPAPPSSPAPSPPPPLQAKGSTLVVESTPSARVIVDEKDRGRTPFTIRVTPGSHHLLVVGPDGQTKELYVDVPAGGQVKKAVFFPSGQ